MKKKAFRHECAILRSADFLAREKAGICHVSTPESDDSTTDRLRSKSKKRQADYEAKKKQIPGRPRITVVPRAYKTYTSTTRTNMISPLGLSTCKKLGLRERA